MGALILFGGTTNTVTFIRDINYHIIFERYIYYGSDVLIYDTFKIVSDNHQFNNFFELHYFYCYGSLKSSFYFIFIVKEVVPVNL